MLLDYNVNKSVHKKQYSTIVLVKAIYYIIVNIHYACQEEIIRDVCNVAYIRNVVDYVFKFIVLIITRNVVRLQC